MTSAEFLDKIVFNLELFPTGKWDYVFDDEDNGIVEMTNVETDETFVISVSKKD